jgi:branched-chain amino acid transport system ATP-binding protein
MRPTLLSIEDLAVSYGGVRALKGVSLEVGEKDIVAVLGANGAGKTTLLRSISRLESPARGAVRLGGQDLSRLHPSRLVGLGIAHVPEGRRVFSTLTVEENVHLGAYGVPAGRGNESKRTKDWIFRLFPILKERRRQLAGTLSGGEQQMMVIARGLMSRPRLLLLDEPSLGLAPIVQAEIFRIIRQIHEDEGVSILLVEQNARKALGLARYAYILEVGNVAIQGDSPALRSDERVRAAYLGGRGQASPKELV